VLARGVATLPQEEPMMVRDSDGRPQEDLVVVHCFCFYTGGAVLGVSLG